MGVAAAVERSATYVSERVHARLCVVRDCIQSRRPPTGDERDPVAPLNSPTTSDIKKEER